MCRTRNIHKKFTQRHLLEKVYFCTLVRPVLGSDTGPGLCSRWREMQPSLWILSLVEALETSASQKSLTPALGGEDVRASHSPPIYYDLALRRPVWSPNTKPDQMNECRMVRVAPRKLPSPSTAATVNFGTLTAPDVALGMISEIFHPNYRATVRSFHTKSKFTRQTRFLPFSVP